MIGFAEDLCQDDLGTVLGKRRSRCMVAIFDHGGTQHPQVDHHVRGLRAAVFDLDEHDIPLVPGRHMYVHSVAFERHQAVVDGEMLAEVVC